MNKLNTKWELLVTSIFFEIFSYKNIVLFLNTLQGLSKSKEEKITLVMSDQWDLLRIGKGDIDLFVLGWRDNNSMQMYNAHC